MATSATPASSGSWVTSRSVRAAQPVHLEEQFDDLPPGRRVEVAGGFVGEKKRRIVSERARNRHPLLLAAGELRRVVMATLATGRLRREARGARARVPRPGDLHRHEHVLERGQRRKQVKELEQARNSDQKCSRARDVGVPRQPAGASRHRLFPAGSPLPAEVDPVVFVHHGVTAEPSTVTVRA